MSDTLVSIQSKRAPVVELTESATAKIKELLEAEGDPELALRIAVRPGGCSGFNYEMFFDKEREDGDHTATISGVQVWVDPSSAELLRGARLDYRDGLQDSGFHLTNPNASRTCGCGQSFS